MKLTLLEIVKDILNDMDSDEVNSISDTVESMQVAQIVKSCYLELMSNRDWPHLRTLGQVEHSGTPDKPTHLRLPENVKELVFFRYDRSNNEAGKILYQDVTYRHPDDFLRLVSSVNPTTPNVKVVQDFSGISIVVKTNRGPLYWTSFDDEYIICDSYDSEVDDALQKSKTQTLMYLMPTWSMLDDYVPDLPAEAFSALVEEAKSTAFFTLKQQGNEKAEQKAARQQRWLSRKAWQAKGGVRYDDYGRRGKK